LNLACVEAIQIHLAGSALDDADPLFKSRKGSKSVNRLVESWCASINLKGNYGSHSLRKTWGAARRGEGDLSERDLMVGLRQMRQDGRS
jgi:hypothetical protein